jgi:ribosomal protein L7/L12
MKDRMFIRSELVGMLSMAMASHQIAEEDVEQANEVAQETGRQVMEIQAEIGEDLEDGIKATAAILMRAFGVNMKICTIRALIGMFDLELKQAKNYVDEVDAYLRQSEPMLYAKEAVQDVEKASARCEKTEMALARFVRENQATIDGALREYDPESCNEGPEVAEELRNLLLENEEAGNQLAEAIKAPSRV